MSGRVIPVNPAVFGAIDVVVNTGLRDGTVLMMGRTMHVGTRPLTVLEQAGKDARMIVRRGMADVLAWLGEAVDNEPTGRQILDALRREYGPTTEETP